MSMGVPKSWDIEFIDIVDNKYNLFLENATISLEAFYTFPWHNKDVSTS